MSESIFVIDTNEGVVYEYRSESEAIDALASIDNELNELVVIRGRRQEIQLRIVPQGQKG